MDMQSYAFADLENHEELVKNIQQLESMIGQQLGHEVTLIAFTQDGAKQEG